MFCNRVSELKLGIDHKGREWVQDLMESRVTYSQYVVGMLGMLNYIAKVTGSGIGLCFCL